MTAHDLVWFFTTGRFDPAWVQVVITTITLAVLIWYACDTHTLAKTSVEQIKFAKRQYDSELDRNYHVAYDCVFKIQNDLIEILSSFVTHTFGTASFSAVYPEDWPDIASALRQHIPDTAKNAIDLGIMLRNVDFSIGQLNGAPEKDKAVCEKKVLDAVQTALEGCKTLTDQMMQKG